MKSLALKTLFLCLCFAFAGTACRKKDDNKNSTPPPAENDGEDGSNGGNSDDGSSPGVSVGEEGVMRTKRSISYSSVNGVIESHLLLIFSTAPGLVLTSAKVGDVEIEPGASILGDARVYDQGKLVNDAIDGFDVSDNEKAKLKVKNINDSLNDRSFFYIEDFNENIASENTNYKITFEFEGKGKTYKYIEDLKSPLFSVED